MPESWSNQPGVYCAWVLGKSTRDLLCLGPEAINQRSIVPRPWGNQSEIYCAWVLGQSTRDLLRLGSGGNQPGVYCAWVLRQSTRDLLCLGPGAINQGSIVPRPWGNQPEIYCAWVLWQSTRDLLRLGSGPRANHELFYMAVDNSVNTNAVKNISKESEVRVHLEINGIMKILRNIRSRRDETEPLPSSTNKCLCFLSRNMLLRCV